MTRFGYTLMTEQSGPKALVEAATLIRELHSGELTTWEGAGFTDIAVGQVGDDGQSEFLAEAAEPLLDKLRAAAG